MYICEHETTNDMNIKKTIREMDEEFAKEAKMTYQDFKGLTLMEQSKIKRKVTNKKLKN